ncbi:hypothetical protein ACFW1M_11100 [Streptomyces inhibens]|uniref:hypothetical protein n=1 Tax=Streptomyces inhibens TaxID=2293571 RepID=UPI003699D0E9
MNSNVNTNVNSNINSNTHTNMIGTGETGREIAVDVDQFVDRYIAVWNEPDPVARRRRIAEVWAADAVELTPEARYQGLEALEERVTSAHNQLVRDGGYLFRSAGDATAHHGAISFTTHMIPAAGGDIAWIGRAFAALDEDHRIRYEYQFTVDLTKAPA